jgi:hypothetical protein
VASGAASKIRPLPDGVLNEIFVDGLLATLHNRRFLFREDFGGL